MLPPPNDVFPRFDYFISPPRADLTDATTYREIHKPLLPKKAKREAFMLCGMISALNEALRYYKQHQACDYNPSGGNDTTRNAALVANMNETYTIHDDPTNF